MRPMLKNLVLKNRSYRRFYQDYAVEMTILKKLVNLARFSPSAGNLQPLKYMLFCDKKKNDPIFPYLSWARYLKGWKGPEKRERPASYIIVLGDTRITTTFGCDHGIASQTILLGAAEIGLGGCIIGSIDRIGLRKALKIPRRYQILFVLAIGKPKEKVIIEPLLKRDIKYWRDRDGIHHVPKRSLKELIINE